MWPARVWAAVSHMHSLRGQGWLPVWIQGLQWVGGKGTWRDSNESFWRRSIVIVPADFFSGKSFWASLWGRPLGNVVSPTVWLILGAHDLLP